MAYPFFEEYFAGRGRPLLKAAIDLALAEDGPDLAAEGVFSPHYVLRAAIVAKEDTLVVGLPLIPLILEACGKGTAWRPLADEGAHVKAGAEAARVEAPAAVLLKAERVMLNFISRLSGIANLTRRYVERLENTGVRLLDTRKTLPGLRWPEKYAVRMGGGLNHRRDLTEILMLKDNHIDAAGSIASAVAALRARHRPCPPIEVECRTENEVREAVAAGADRIMLDNMDVPALEKALPLIPPRLEAEISGGVALKNIRTLALAGTRRADFISVGRLTHSARAADFSMRLLKGAL